MGNNWDPIEPKNLRFQLPNDDEIMKSVIEPVPSDPIQATNLGITLAFPTHLEVSSYLKEGEKTVSKPNVQVEWQGSSLGSVKEALTWMVFPEETDTVESDPVLKSRGESRVAGLCISYRRQGMRSWWCNDWWPFTSNTRLFPKSECSLGSPYESLI